MGGDATPADDVPQGDVGGLLRILLRCRGARHRLRSRISDYWTGWSHRIAVEECDDIARARRLRLRNFANKMAAVHVSRSLSKQDRSGSRGRRYRAHAPKSACAPDAAERPASWTFR